MMAIIGASGKLRRRTVEALLARGIQPEQVVAAVRIPDTEQDYIDICREDGEPEFMIHFLLTLYRDIKNGLLEDVSNDIEKLSGHPAESFESFLRRKTDK